MRPNLITLLLFTLALSACGKRDDGVDTPVIRNSSATGVAIGDVDGDGKPDIVFSRVSGDIIMLKGHGDGNFDSPKRLPY